MKTDVGYTLDLELREDIKGAKNKIISYLGNAELYLFGSIAKGCYRKGSDIDLLILMSQDMETREIRYLRHALQEVLEGCDLSREVDLKIYSSKRYEELCQKPCFEQCIQQDLIYINNW